jgi:hypothetical protein
MKNKLICLITVLVLISTSFVAVASNLESNSRYSLIVSEINYTKNRKLTADSTFGNIDVKYYEHYINGFKVVNDRILFQTYSGTNDIIKYEKQWRSVDDIFTPCSDVEFEPESNYKTKEKIVFLDEKDLGYFYTIEKDINYPLFCWKVFYKNGETILYDYFDGEEIGYGILAPSIKGLAWNGYTQASQPNGYAPWRENAAKWFRKWGLDTNELALPNPDDISSRIKNSDFKCWFHFAHGDSFTLWLNREDGKDTYYYSFSFEDKINAEDDMKNRPPIKFAYLGSCNVMDELRESTFSYTFRKGNNQGSVVVGFWDLLGENGPNGGLWGHTMTWQESLFKYMYNGHTFEEAYNKACADVPQSDHDVRWVGDGSLTLDDILNEPPNKPDTPTGITEGNVGEEYVFSTSATDPNGDELYYQWNWDDGTSTNWQGPYSSGEEINAYHAWESEEGYYDVKVRAKDEHGDISEWADPLTIHIQNQPPYNPNKPNGPTNVKASQEHTYTTSAIDPEEQQIRYVFDWGDGKQTYTDYINSGSIIEAKHSWDSAGNYEIKVKAQDEGGEESDWSESLSVSVEKNKNLKNNTGFLSNFINIFIKRIFNFRNPESREETSFPIFNIIKKINLIDKTPQNIGEVKKEKKF